tara:strand:+ start:19 stop:741 length:723 start_codon:yes stop_codon:yes gene_type:complete
MNIIQFIATKEYVDLKEHYPKPIKYNIPEWFKKLNHSFNNKTIKGCLPFLDTLTSGYVLEVPQDFEIYFKKTGEANITFANTSNEVYDSFNLNKGTNTDVHPYTQLGKSSPLVHKNKASSIFKILNPWIIKTPPGYSCLFVPPLNNTDDRFSIMPGIVDTDTFHNRVNFPFILNGDKYDTLKSLVKKGTNYVQVIPFKRESWKMKIETIDDKKQLLDKIVYGFRLFMNYKTGFWKKKTWI